MNERLSLSVNAGIALAMSNPRDESEAAGQGRG